jgi:NAD(P)-dependent dehydrogenase (short-subunit alcohol dehydrogenase family)
MGKLDGKVAVVTGGNSGIGLASAKRLVSDGAYVFITARRKGELDAAAAEIGKNIIAVQCDVSKLADLDRLFATVKEVKGHVDILFANAGIAEGAPLGAITEDQFDRHFGINVKGALFTAQKALPLLTEGASIILTSSIVGSKGPANRSVYSATKAALRSFARTWTTDLKAHKIRVNVVSPGATDTPGLRGLSKMSAEGLTQLYRDHVPLGRLGRPEDVAGAVSFLASDDSSYISGIELFVDGGLAQV